MPGTRTDIARPSIGLPPTASQEPSKKDEIDAKDRRPATFPEKVCAEHNGAGANPQRNVSPFRLLTNAL